MTIISTEHTKWRPHAHKYGFLYFTSRAIHSRSVYLASPKIALHFYTIILLVHGSTHIICAEWCQMWVAKHFILIVTGSKLSVVGHTCVALWCDGDCERTYQLNEGGCCSWLACVEPHAMSTVCRSAVQEIIPLSYKTLGACVTELHAVISLNEQDESNYLLGVDSSFPFPEKSAFLANLKKTNLM